MIAAILLLLALILTFVFAPTKIAGYYAAGLYLKRAHPSAGVRPMMIAVPRAVAGVCIDVLACSAAFSGQVSQSRSLLILVYVLVMLGRGMAWAFVISAAISEEAPTARVAEHVVVATLWSSFLDLLGGVLSFGAIALVERAVR